jgi:hypothetical protein
MSGSVCQNYRLIFKILWGSVYPLEFFDAIRVKSRDEVMVGNEAIHIAFNIRTNGGRQVIGLWVERNGWGSACKKDAVSRMIGVPKGHLIPVV